MIECDAGIQMECAICWGCTINGWHSCRGVRHVLHEGHASDACPNLLAEREPVQR